jgi:hypothetical protein
MIMEDKDKSHIVPDQQTGKAIDAASTTELAKVEDAKVFFGQAKERLQNVNQWKDIAGTLSATFQLVDAKGNEVQRKAQKGDYLKIDIPGPGTNSGEGYDWVKIEEVENTRLPNGERFAFRVRPTDNPQNQKEDVAHFYSEESTSSFVVERQDNNVTASVHDRNTKPNTDADSAIDKVRDAVVGAAGVASFSKIQWKKLTDGLVSRKQ